MTAIAAAVVIGLLLRVAYCRGWWRGWELGYSAGLKTRFNDRRRVE